MGVTPRHLLPQYSVRYVVSTYYFVFGPTYPNAVLRGFHLLHLLGSNPYCLLPLSPPALTPVPSPNLPSVFVASAPWGNACPARMQQPRCYIPFFYTGTVGDSRISASESHISPGEMPSIIHGEDEHLRGLLHTGHTQGTCSPNALVTPVTITPRASPWGMLVWPGREGR